jgi:hypothetical protein
MRNAFLFAIAAWILLCPATGEALTIKLRTGDYLTGEITQADENGFEFKRWDNDGLISIKWFHLPAAEISRLKDLLQIKVSRSASKVAGEKVFTISGAVYEGLVTDEETNILIKSAGGTKRIVKKDIQKREPVQIDLFKVYTYQECYAKMLSDIKADKASDQFKLAEYCQEALRMFDKAKEHYTKAGELDALYWIKATKKIAEIDVLIVQEAIGQIDKYLEKPTPKLIEQAKELLAGLNKQYENSENTDILKSIEAATARIDVVEKSLADKNLQEASKKIAKQYYTVMKSELRKLSEPKITYANATLWASGTVPKNIIAKLAKDNKITEDDVTKIVGNMSKLEGLAPRTASFGEGSWLVASPPPAPTTGDITQFTQYQEKMKRINDAKTKAATANELLTAETWWLKTAAPQRETYLEAWYAERFLTVVEKKEKPCPNCSGEGVIQSKLCNRCWGTLVEITIIYK